MITFKLRLLVWSLVWFALYCAYAAWLTLRGTSSSLPAS